MSSFDINKNDKTAKKPLPFKFFDGAFGTYYAQLTGDEEPCELANINNPSAVIDIHRQYIAAGAQAIKSNTYHVSGSVIGDSGLVREIIHRGFELAEKACEGTDAVAVADIGYIPKEEGEVNHYLPVVDAFAEKGARWFLFETCAGFDEENGIREAVLRAKNSGAGVIVTFAVMQDGYTSQGRYYLDLLNEAAAFGADAVGLNCLCGPAHMQSLIKKLFENGGVSGNPTIVAMPNAGYPTSQNGRMFFQSNAEYFAQRAAEIYSAGADVVGGCCGTTPEHISLSCRAVEGSAKTPAVSASQKVVYAERAQRIMPRSAKPKHGKLIAVEIDAPTDCDDSFIIEAAAAMKEKGADMITVADSPLSRARADSIIMAARIKRIAGIDVVPHMACRDRNRIAIKSGLLGAALEGIDKALVITGDPLPSHDRAGEKSVFAFNSMSLISYIVSMNKEVFAGREFAVTAALNVNAANFDAELSRAQRKQDAGALRFFTQAIFSQRACENFFQAKAELSAQVFAGILPVASHKNAAFLNNEVNGIDVPEELIERLEAAQSARERRLISRAFAWNVVDKLYDAADGFYIMMPLKSVRLTGEIVEYIAEKGTQ